VTRFHPMAYRLTGGRGPIGRVLGLQMVVLTTIGRRSGQPRDAPLFALRDGSTFLLVGTHGGEEKLPDWVANLRVTPEATLQVGRQRRAVRAREPEPRSEQYRALWARAVAAYPGYAEYRARRSTDPPIVVLEPR
jgi:F420H(2)-dependent quinone reductase